MIFTQKEVEKYCLDEFVAAEYCSLSNGHDGQCGNREELMEVKK